MLNKKRLFLSPPHMGGTELSYIKDAFQSNYIAPLGPMVDAFEKEFSSYTGIKNCLALNSGTAATHLALRELGVGINDFVLASSLTFIGSVTPVLFQGATVKFLDSDRKTWNMDPNLLDEELKECANNGRMPKAVIPTDLYGQCAEYDTIYSLCNKYGIPVVVDSAESIGSRYKDVHAGKGAKCSIYSFNGNKIITTSGGGMLASDDAALIEHARKLSQQARDPAPHYQHSEIGYNYRMSNIVAAIGRGQLKVLDERVARKRQIFKAYVDRLRSIPGIEFMPEANYGKPNRWLTVILLEEDKCGANPDKIRLALEAENIESRPIWKPLHLQPVFQNCSVRLNGVSQHLFKRGLCLPSGTAMTDSDLDRVAETIKQCVESNN